MCPVINTICVGFLLVYTFGKDGEFDRFFVSLSIVPPLIAKRNIIIKMSWFLSRSFAQKLNFMQQKPLEIRKGCFLMLHEVTC